MVETAASNTIVQPPMQADWIVENHDPETEEMPDIEVEMKRLRALKSYALLDTPPQACYDRLTALAQNIFKTRIAVITLIDLGRAWSLSAQGLGDAPRESPRKITFCGHTILRRTGTLILRDARKNPTFASSPFVQGPFGLRFYAAKALIAPDGSKIGTFCLIDSEPREFTDEDEKMLEHLACTVVELMEAHRRAHAANQLADVERAAASVQAKLQHLCQDEQLRKSLSRAQVHTLTSASESALSLCRALQRRNENDAGKTKASAASAAVDKKRKREPDAEGTEMPNKKESIGEVRDVKLTSFVKSLQVVMPNVASGTRVSFCVDESLPERAVFNDLMIFRSALAVLERASKKKQPNFIAFRVSRKDSDKGDQLVFECEDVSIIVAGEQSQPPAKACALNGAPKMMCGCNDPIDSDDEEIFAIPVVAQYIGSMDGGMYGSTVIEGGKMYWFSIPLKLP